MSAPSFLPRAQRVAIVIGGPTLVGLCTLLSTQPQLDRGVSFPILWVGVAVVMLPTLYIGSALAGIAPPIRDLSDAALNALERSAFVLIGLAPTLAFLIASSTEPGTETWLTRAVLAIGAALGLLVLHGRCFCFSRGRVRGGVLFVLWGVLSLAIGAHLFSSIAGV